MISKCITLLSLSLLSFFILCNQTVNEGFLGSAIVEATTIQIATTAQGTIVALYRDEGDRVRTSDTLAIIDTVSLVLKRKELEAGMKEIHSSVIAKQMEIDALDRDIIGLERDYKRIESLAQSGAVPLQQRDNLKTQLESLEFKRKAQQALLASIHDKLEGFTVRLEQINNQVKDCFVTAPGNGIICTRFHNEYEVIGPGNPIVELCVNDTLQADFFIPQTILGSLAIGDTLRARIDNSTEKGSDPVYLPALLTWISEEAEFSPKNIQTRESRNELVFRMRITIPNRDGMLKRGLPIEIWR
jgi:HlyD family secretion protein